MKLKCLLFGCKWNAGVRLFFGNEHLLLQHCERCPAHRYRSE